MTPVRLTPAIPAADIANVRGGTIGGSFSSPSGGGNVPVPPPAGLTYLIDANGNYFIDANGNYFIDANGNYFIVGNP